MRLWSLHPQYLDPKGLVAVWREALLAQKVLQGKTRGYRQHPQLIRFKNQPDPIAAIGAYLQAIADEATKRGYHFDASKIASNVNVARASVTRGQLDYEWTHLKRKLRTRDPQKYRALHQVTKKKSHPLFRVVKGDVEAWEILK